MDDANSKYRKLLLNMCLDILKSEEHVVRIMQWADAKAIREDETKCGYKNGYQRCILFIAHHAYGMSLKDAGECIGVTAGRARQILSPMLYGLMSEPQCEHRLMALKYRAYIDRILGGYRGSIANGIRI